MKPAFWGNIDSFHSVVQSPQQILLHTVPDNCNTRSSVIDYQTDALQKSCVSPRSNRYPQLETQPPMRLPLNKFGKRTDYKRAGCGSNQQYVPILECRMVYWRHHNQIYNKYQSNTYKIDITNSLLQPQCSGSASYNWDNQSRFNSQRSSSHNDNSAPAGTRNRSSCFQPTNTRQCCTKKSFVGWKKLASP